MSEPRKPSSRPAGGRPRKIAGQQRPATDPVVEDDPVAEEGAPAPVAEPPQAASGAGDGGVETGPPPSSTTEPPPHRRLTWVLLAAVVVLALVVIAEVVYLVRDPEPAVSAERPVVTGELSHRAAVEAAARATEEILSTTYTDYDKQVDQASSKMTDAFAKEYRETAEGIRDEFIEKRSKLQVKAVAQGVAQASPEQVQALLFLNQYVEKVEDGEPQTAYAQYRALVTVVRTDHGWLVSDIETK
jgi:Mce-associated membrane protein